MCHLMSTHLSDIDEMDDESWIARFEERLCILLELFLFLVKYTFYLYHSSVDNENMCILLFHSSLYEISREVTSADTLSVFLFEVFSRKNRFSTCS